MLISTGAILPFPPRFLTALKRITDRLMAHEAAGYFCLQIHNPDGDTQYLESCPDMCSEVNLNVVLVNIKCLNVGSNIHILLQILGRIFNVLKFSFQKW